MNASQHVARHLKRLGVRHAFGMPGGDALPLLDAFLDEGIEFVLIRHEGSAGFMAVGVYSNNSSWREDMPGTGPGQPVQRLQGLLGQDS